MARALMLQGTGSDVGKTVLVAGLCRAARRRGLAVRPFKPQNMSNNAAVAAMPDGSAGGEIGRAQWLQALACGVPPSVDMNPVLLKPQSETGSQVVVHGRMIGSARARDYQDLKPKLMDAVLESWRRLGEGADLVIVEGAGSPAEINLRSRDIANMGFATRADVPVVLVGDIDRGGVIASLVGTHRILPDGDRKMIAGYVINKFRGDATLFDEGITAIGRFTGWPCFGVVPWLQAAARLPAEDSVALEHLSRTRGHGVTIAVPMLGRIANFDDVDPLQAEKGVDVVFVKPGERIPAEAAVVVVPGSKSTIADLAGFRQQGWDRDLATHRERGTTIVGLCGGYQMLGRTVSDPDGIEGAVREAPGLGLLDVDTVMRAQKTVRLSSAVSARWGLPLEGYEIHLGETSGPDTARPVTLRDGAGEGATSADGRVFGTYLHGLFGAGAFRQRFLAGLGVAADGVDHIVAIETALDDLAEALERHLDCDALFALAR